MSLNDTDRIRQRLLRIIGGRYPNNPRIDAAIDTADEHDMKLVLARPADRAILTVDPESGEHFLFRTDEVGDYDDGEHIAEITAGEPVPDRFLGTGWGVIDRDWRHRVVSDQLSKYQPSTA
jgi:hypothetical protein